MKALSISDRLGIERYISQQINYSLLARDAEHELVPAASTSGRASWPGVPCNSASCPANSAAARRSPPNRG